MVDISPIIQKYISEVAPKGVEIKIKEESWIMRLCTKLVKPFNPLFQFYITTLGKIIFAPKSFLQNQDPIKILEVVVHECRHASDFVRHPFLFVLGYTFPQILFFPALLLGLINPWLMLVSLVFLAPLPAPFRYHYELVAYRTSILFAKKVFRASEKDMEKVYLWITKQLSEKWYYFTFPFPNKIMKDLKDDSFMSEPEYKKIEQFLVENGLIIK